MKKRPLEIPIEWLIIGLAFCALIGQVGKILVEMHLERK